MTKQIGPYRVRREVGRGGMGAVYQAADPGGGEDVAVKVLLDGRALRADARERFRIEAAALARLDHPDIVRVHASGDHEGCPYLVMELVRGCTSLRDRLERSGPLEPVEAAELIERLARALDHAHARNIIHRDLKPANVLLRPSGEPLLTDFGLARDLDHSRGPSRSGAIMGTPGYWAPEMLESGKHPPDPRTDVYGLGALLYASLTGAPPCAGETFIALLTATRERPPRPPSELNPVVDPRIEAICLRCLEKDPAARYATAGELARELARYRQAPEQTPVRRGPLLVAAALVLPAGLLFAAALIWRARSAGPMVPPATADPARPAAVSPPAPELEQLVDRSVALADERDHESAIEHARRAIDLDPSRPGGWYALGHALLIARELPGSLEALDRALELDPAHVEAWIDRALARFVAADFQAAADDAREALILDDDRADAWYARGAALQMLGEEEQALEACERAVALEPTMPEAHGVAGIIHQGRGELEQAIEHYDQAIASMPGYGAALLGRGQARLDLEYYEDALADYDACLALGNSDEAASRAGRGVVLLNLGRLEAAEADLDRALELDPGRSLTWMHRMIVRQKRGDLHGALGDAERAARLEPDDPSLINNLGTMLASVGRFDEAVAAVTRALELSPNDVGFLTNRAYILESDGRIEEAIADYRLAVEVAPPGHPRKEELRRSLARAEASLR